MELYFSKIPRSLRCVAPILEEAQSILSYYSYNDLKEMRVAVHFIDNCIHLINCFALALDADAVKLLDEYRGHREVLVDLLRPTGLITDANLVAPTSYPEHELLRPTAEGALLAEAHVIMALATAQYGAGMYKLASRSSHTASLFYRVIMAIAPGLCGEVRDNIIFSARLTRQCSVLTENFVFEHLESHSCADFYETMGTNSQLGVGSYGSVYSCRCKRTGEIFACKVIGLNRINAHYLRKLHSEIAIMKDVCHPNIVKVREVFFGSRTVYIVMDMCRGGELFSQLTSCYKKGFPEVHAALLMRDMISAVKYLHSKGIVHRDIKLENFLFAKETDDHYLKLIDFGLSKHKDYNVAMTQVVGSAYYTAPEVLRGDYDHRCDIWSLGVVAYMLLSGSPPFYGESPEDIHVAIETSELSFPLKRFGHITTGCLDFVKKMLVKDRDKRMTLDDAIKHPFILSANNYVVNGSKAAVHPDIVRRKSYISAPPAHVVIAVGQFLQSDPVQRFVMEAVGFSIAANLLTDLADDFFSMDVMRNGYISLSNVKDALVVALESSTIISIKTQIQQLLVKLATMEDNERVSFSQFASVVTCKRVVLTDKQLGAAFAVLDIGGTGQLTVETFLTLLGVNVSFVTPEKLLEELDVNKCGFVDFTQFLTYFRKLQKVYAMEHLLLPKPAEGGFLRNPVRSILSSVSSRFRNIGNFGMERIQRSVTTSHVQLPPISASSRRMLYDDASSVNSLSIPQRALLPSISTVESWNKIAVGSKESNNANGPGSLPI